jgi:hypothetical protein
MQAKEEQDRSTNQSNEEMLEGQEQLNKKSKTRNYMDQVDGKNKHIFRPRTIIIGVVTASVVVVILEMLIRGVIH